MLSTEIYHSFESYKKPALSKDEFISALIGRDVAYYRHPNTVRRGEVPWFRYQGQQGPTPLEKIVSIIDFDIRRGKLNPIICQETSYFSWSEVEAWASENQCIVKKTDEQNLEEYKELVRQIKQERPESSSRLAMEDPRAKEKARDLQLAKKSQAAIAREIFQNKRGRPRGS